MGPHPGMKREHTYNCQVLTNDSGNVMHPIFPYNFTTHENICQTRRRDKLSSSIPDIGLCYIADYDGGYLGDNQPILRIYDDDTPSEFAAWSNISETSFIPVASLVPAIGNAVLGDADESDFLSYLLARDNYTNSNGITFKLKSGELNRYGDDLCIFAPTKDESECHHYYNAVTGELCGAAGWNLPVTCTSRARNYTLVDDPVPNFSDIKDTDQTHCTHIEPCGMRVRNDPNNDYVADQLVDADDRRFERIRRVITCKDLGTTTSDISTDSDNPNEIGYDKKCSDFYVIDDEGHRRNCSQRSRSEGGRFSCENPPAVTDFDDSDTPKDSDGVSWCKGDPYSCDSWLRKTFGPDSPSPPENRRRCDTGIRAFRDYTRSIIRGDNEYDGYTPDAWNRQRELYEQAGQFCSNIGTSEFQETLSAYCELEYGNR